MATNDAKPAGEHGQTPVCPPRKILYGVHGYGRGHSARAQAILPELMARHDVRILAADDAYDQLRGDYDVVRIPGLRYHHGANNRRCLWLTLKRNLPGLADMLLEGPVHQMVQDEIRRFGPDVVISDSECWTHRAARRLGVPRISFDRFGVIGYCRLGLSGWEALEAGIESLVYCGLTANPERIVVVSFYGGTPRRPGVRVVGPIIRREAREIQPRDGDFLLVYFSNAHVHFTPAIESALGRLDTPVRVYGLPREGAEGNITFCRPGNLLFLRDLAECRAIFATAGNQLISEALHFEKPMLLMPEQSLEQRLNARFVQQWQVGKVVKPRQVTPQLLREFLSRRDALAENIRPRRRDGLREAMGAINEALSELTR